MFGINALQTQYKRKVKYNNRPDVSLATLSNMLEASAKISTISADLVDDCIAYLIIVGNWALES